MLGVKSTVVFAFLAISARLAVAAPPACLLAAVKYGILQFITIGTNVDLKY